MAIADDVRNLADQLQTLLGQGTRQVQQRLDDLRRRRRFDELAGQLGRVVYRARDQGRTGEAEVEAEVERLCRQLAAVEAEIAAAAAAAADPDSPGPPRDPAEHPPALPAPGYTLDDV
jgi:ABC-type phosphate transport system auxiliary subunit